MRHLLTWPAALLAGSALWISGRLWPTHEPIEAGHLLALRRTLKRQHQVVDLRPRAAFQAEHLPGSITLPLDDPGTPAALRALWDGVCFMVPPTGADRARAEALARRARLPTVRYVEGGWPALQAAIAVARNQPRTP